MLLTIVAMSVLFVLSYYYWDSEKADKHLVKDSLQKSLARYELAKTNTNILKQYKMRYESLKEKGLIESNDRLSWVNAMEAAVNKSLITSVQYKIDKQIKYNESGLSRAYPDIEIFKSSMIIDMELLHEGDLYAFFDELKNNTKGFFEIKSCVLNASAKALEDILETLSDSNLKARCDINWYSIRSKGA